MITSTTNVLKVFNKGKGSKVSIHTKSTVKTVRILELAICDIYKHISYCNEVANCNL